jgi:glycogen debranching enzyme
MSVAVRVPPARISGLAPSSHVRAEQRYAWCGPSLLVSGIGGTVGRSEPLSGYYFREARHLSTLRLRLNGELPWLCSDASVSQRETAFVFVYPELKSFGGGGSDASDDTTWRDEHGVAQRAVDAVLRFLVHPHQLECSLTVTNRSADDVPLEIAWELDADFADLQEALADGRREQTAPVACEVRPDALRFRYGHPGVPLETDVMAVGPATWAAREGLLAANVRLPPRQTLRLTLVVTPWSGGAPALTAREAEERLATAGEWRRTLTRLDTPRPSPEVDTVRQALDDIGSLALLTGERDEWLALQAGIPLYPALFGRDTITAGWAIPMFDAGAVADASLTRLGRMQSHRMNEWRDEEPGRIPYQVRSGPLAALDLTPYAAYYADFASPLLFIHALAHLFAWRGSRDVLRRHWDVARRIMDWARNFGDRDRDGYLEYLTRSSRGTKNQGWKDSGNAILYEDGRPVPAPAGTCDLQGYWFAAQQLMAVMCGFMGELETARAYWREASDLKQRFNRDWWIERENFFALALDPEKRLAGSVTSNVGHCLAAGIIDDEHLPRVVGRMFEADLFSGWGIRTLSTRHPSYNPLGYHVGSVWPVENATMAFGLRRFGFDQRAGELTEAYFELSRLYERGRIPECVGGYARGAVPQPGAYPRANPIQAWNQSGYALLLQTMLGLQPVAPAHTLIVDPVLPPWLPELILRDLRLGEARVTLRFVRGRHGRSHGEVVKRSGPFHLVHQPPVESTRAGLKDRFAALATTILHH